MSVPSRYVQKWAPWSITPARNASAWTRLPISRPCMSVIATISVSIRPSPTIASSSRRRACLAWPWSSLLIADFLVLAWTTDSSAPSADARAPGRPAAGLSRGLLRGHPAVGHDDRPGNERRLVRGEEQGNVGDLARLAWPADRLERVDRGVDLGEAAEHLGVSVVDRRVDPARGDRVAADLLLGVVQGDPLREHHDRALRRGVDRQEWLGHEPVHRGRVDQRSAAPLEHVRDGVAAAVDRALDVDVQGPVDDLVGGLVEDPREVHS